MGLILEILSSLHQAQALVHRLIYCMLILYAILGIYCFFILGSRSKEQELHIKQLQAQIITLTSHEEIKK